MKLYYSPGACSLSPHIVLKEMGLPAEYMRVDTKTHKTKAGEDFYAINPNGQVPVLELKGGERLTEGPAIVQYLAEQKGDTTLMPASGLERARVQSLLNFVTSEIHKTYTPLFKPNTPEEYKTIAKGNLATRYKYLDKVLEGKKYLTGDNFTVADAYLFTVTNWARFHNIDLAQWPNVKAFQERVAQRPAVREAMKEEGLIQ